jgi:hypothetical protein
MEKENIQSEINELEKIRSKWSYTSMNKAKTNDLLSTISIFNHTFSLEFPNAIKYYKRNSPAEILISDGISELKMFADSNLKKKDDHYFHEGLKNVTYGIKRIIMSLENEIKEIE